MNLRRYMAVAIMALAFTAGARSEELLMARSQESFPETMLRLQESVTDHGYTLSRVQRVDIGLTESGFVTDKYRIVFFGKPAEVRHLVQNHPQLIPYLPLQMTVFEEGDETVIVTSDPMMLQKLAPDAEITYLFMRWKNDLLSIMEDLRNAR